jgi:hypothetical protein
MGPRLRLCGTVALLVFALGIVGCVRSVGASNDSEPARLEAITGTSLHRVILTEAALENVGIRTEPSREATSNGTTSRSAVPMTAVIYDPTGTPWVYSNPDTRTYVRVPIVIDHTSATTAYLTSGPPVGTAVVTVGASELLGTEYGVGGE